MASFEDILNKPASELKAPPAFPVGTYHCVVDGPAEQGKSSKKQTDFLRFKFKIVRPQEDVNAEEAQLAQVQGKTVTEDFYITDTAAYRVKEFLVDTLGIEPGEEGSPSEKTITQMLMEAPNKQLLVKLKHELSQDGKRVFHRVESTAKV